MEQQHSLFVTIALTLTSVAVMVGIVFPSITPPATERTFSAEGPVSASDIHSTSRADQRRSDGRDIDNFRAKMTDIATTPRSAANVDSLKVDKSGRFLIRNDGTPFFWLADSAQLLLYRLSREDVDLYLRHRARLGFTVIQTQIVSFLGSAATNFYGDAPFINGDPSRPNERFWQHADYVINKAASLGLVIALVPDRNLVVVDHTTHSFGPLTVSSAYQYGLYVGRRYRGKPVVWVLGWDIAPAGREAVFQAEAEGIANGVADGDHSKVLMTFHPQSSNSSSAWFHHQDWLDFNSIQSGHMDNPEAQNFPETHSLISSDYAKVPTKPTLDNEPAYEDTEDGFWTANKGLRMGADVIRRKAYWGVFAGAFGHTYGHNDIVAFHAPGRRSHSGQRDHWKNVLDAPGATDMRRLLMLVESRPQLGRIPDQSVLASPPGSGRDHVRATRSSDGSYAFIYTPNPRPVSVRMVGIKGKSVQAAWFDPRTGAFSDRREFCKEEIQSFDPPAVAAGGNDWVLVLDGLLETNLSCPAR
jgi:hypothetical protein